MKLLDTVIDNTQNNTQEIQRKPVKSIEEWRHYSMNVQQNGSGTQFYIACLLSGIVCGLVYLSFKGG